MLINNPTVVSRFAIENILKIGYPCSCHVSPFESESYKTFFCVRESPRISSISVTCSNCNQSKNFNVEDRYLSEYDVKDL